MAQKKGTKKKSTKKTTAKKAATGTSSVASGSSRKKSTKKKSTRTKKSTTMSKEANQNGKKPTSTSSRQAADAAQNGDPVHEAPTVEELRKVKTGLTKRDMEKYRKLLLEKRGELVGDMESLKADARGSGEGISYEHMADVGTDSYEQEFTLGLVESERRMLEEIDEALSRIADGTYGVCMESAEPISRARLEAKPWAKYTIEVEREREKRGL